VKILLISYYAPPLNAITSLRAYSLAKQLSKDNEVHLVTKNWRGNENTWEEVVATVSKQKVIKENNLSIHYLPFASTKYASNTIVRKLKTLLNIIGGKFDNEINTFQFYDYSSKLLNSGSFDYIYVTSPPVNIVSLGTELSLKHNIKLIVDFRDLHNEILLKKGYKKTLQEKIEVYFLKKYLKKNLVNASFISTVNEPITNFLDKLNIKNVSTVLNGFERDVFESLKEEKIERFDITLIGTIYPQQNIEIILSGFKKFISDKKNYQVHINFIGVGAIPEVAEQIMSYFSNEYLTITNKIERKKALQIAKNSQVLFYMGWKGYRGIYSGKIFEYIGLKKNILIAPGDNDVLDNLIKITKSGVIAETDIAVKEALEHWFFEWEEKGTINYNGVNIETYSREFQNELIINKLNKTDAQ